MFIRIEPSSSVPIYRQIADQIRYQIAAGILKEGDRIPSVRELASQVAVNQNTILKVYNELCREKVLKIVRGEGTYVSSSKQNIPIKQRKEMVAGPLREAAVLAIQLGIPVEQVSNILQSEYDKINARFGDVADFVFEEYMDDPAARDVEPPRLIDLAVGPAFRITMLEQGAPDLDVWEPTSVYLLGAGEGHSHEHISAARSLTTSAAKEAGERAYAMAGLAPADMSFAQLYDCFTPTGLVELEDLGFCAKGEGGAFVGNGNIELSGALPVNTHGGLLSHSHTGHPGSMFALTEAVTQLRGDTGARQVPGAEIGLVHGQGGVLSSHATMLLGTGATL